MPRQAFSLKKMPKRQSSQKEIIFWKTKNGNGKNGKLGNWILVFKVDCFPENSSSVGWKLSSLWMALTH